MIWCCGVVYIPVLLCCCVYIVLLSSYTRPLFSSIAIMSPSMPVVRLGDISRRQRGLEYMAPCMTHEKRRVRVFCREREGERRRVGSYIAFLDPAPPAPPTSPKPTSAPSAPTPPPSPPSPPASPAPPHAPVPPTRATRSVRASRRFVVMLRLRLSLLPSRLVLNLAKMVMMVMVMVIMVMMVKAGATTGPGQAKTGRT
ncbi:hypothetical protein EJ05DRAFT_133918 [Pseudovirgaria hyperparasitica]|uniref:Uncharacterized protein n=1 Tax=Pseudovirgaria hyperparasitica TaxID=470096 RepID=A0A6A6VXA3_9PEZI|nr:uncharacterized protein EJ05DRAFT_133918 [Pseudovirgaria hyperparasitica]KAF2754805.1 hypothetical protein EJ05DRAFT_133918 [Pseudovirgaria hyperparasitica]